MTHAFKFSEHVETIVADVGFRPGYRLHVGEDSSRTFIQVWARIVDVTSWPDPRYKLYKGGKHFLSNHMVDGEIVQRALVAYLAFEEHEVREAFTYKGKRIYGPHIDPEALLEVADRTVGRT